MTAKGIRRLDEILNGVVKESPLAPGLLLQSALEGWTEIVGEQIARHSRALSLNDGVLMVQVDGSVWAQELSLLSPEIQERFNRRLGSTAVREIRFRSAAL